MGADEIQAPNGSTNSRKYVAVNSSNVANDFLYAWLALYQSVYKLALVISETLRYAQNIFFKVKCKRVLGTRDRPEILIIKEE